MKDHDAFTTGKAWFKGNLHTHSSISDGRLRPNEVVERYQALGYHFLAFTEHETFSAWREFDREDFLLLPGIEVGSNDASSGPFRCHHIVGIARQPAEPLHLTRYDNSQLQALPGAQSIVNQLTRADFLTIYCHPVWSRQSFCQIAELQDFTAIEVYNHGCHLENHTGSASYYWDAFLRQGQKIWAVATDDSHQIIDDLGGGWVVVNAPELSVAAISQALVDGNFYSSTGPVIEAYGVRDNKVYVSCSPARSIHFVAFERRGKSYHQTDQGPLREASYALHGDETYVRIEVVDEEGKTAWSNPIFSR